MSDLQNTARPQIVVGLGEVLWDLLPDGRVFGGAPANFAYHARCLGAKASVVSAVGADDAGQEILGILDRTGLDRGGVAVLPSVPTGTVTIQVLQGGQPQYTIHEQVAWDFIPFGPDLDDLAGRADAVCFGTLASRSTVSQVTIQRFLESTRRGCLRLFDVNLRQQYYDRASIERGLGSCTVLKVNDQELAVLGDLLGLTGIEEDQVRQLLDRYRLQMVVLTRGDRGSLLMTAEGRSERLGRPTKVVDTVGAGDAFAAVVGMGLLRGLPLAQIHAAADGLAAYVCSQQGATPRLSQALLRGIGW